MLIKFNQVTLILLVSIVICVVGQFSYQEECCTEYCFAEDRDRPQVKRFSTKTPYEFARTENRRYFNVPNCTPEKFWILSRHGTRLPRAKDLKGFRELQELRDEIIANYEVRRTKPDRGAMCQSDLNLLAQWRWDSNITEQFDQFLTAEGYNELKNIAYNYKNYYPQLLTNIYTPEKFLFRHTDTQRTKASFQAFSEGLFGSEAARHVRPAEIPQRDLLLRPYDYCPEYANNTQSKKNPDSEISKLLASSTFKELVSDVSKRFG